VSHHHQSFRAACKTLDALIAVEPFRMVASKPSLRNSIVVVFFHVEQVASKNESALVQEVELHAHGAVGVARDMV